MDRSTQTTAFPEGATDNAGPRIRRPALLPFLRSPDGRPLDPLNDSALLDSSVGDSTVGDSSLFDSAVGDDESAIGGPIPTPALRMAALPSALPEAEAPALRPARRVRRLRLPRVARRLRDRAPREWRELAAGVW
ncbi:MAG: hypothetical protein ACRDD1_21965, partial [Planctomycetia bacterium]